MGVKDRLRAKKPPEDDKRWSKCKLKTIKEKEAIVKDQKQEIKLELTSELVKLFKSRMDGENAWYIKKS